MHNWLKQTCVAFVPGPESSQLESTFVDSLLGQFRALGHTVQDLPDEHTDMLLTTAPFGKSISWRKALLFTGRARFKYRHSPTVFTLIHVPQDELERQLAYFQRALEKDEPDPSDYNLPGLASDAYKVLHEQGKRGGPILSLERLLQAQSKCINILLLVGEKEIHTVYHFDLVGAHPATWRIATSPGSAGSASSARSASMRAAPVARCAWVKRRRGSRTVRWAWAPRTV